MCRNSPDIPTGVIRVNQQQRAVGLPHLFQWVLIQKAAVAIYVQAKHWGWSLKLHIGSGIFRAKSMSLGTFKSQDRLCSWGQPLLCKRVYSGLSLPTI